MRNKYQSTFYCFARPVQVGEKCLRCHGIPKEAPKDQVEIYGTESGCGWHKGQVVSASIVYVPMDAAMTAAKKSATTLFVMGLAGIVGLMAVIWFFLSSGVVRPLAKNLMSILECRVMMKLVIWQKPLIVYVSVLLNF